MQSIQLRGLSKESFGCTGNEESSEVRDDVLIVQ